MRGPDRHRAEVASGLIREYIYLRGEVSPKDGTRVYLIMPTSNTACAPPKDNPCDEIREKIFKNDALKSIDAVRANPEEAILSMERKPEIVKSIPSFPYIIKSL
ncbi:MAG: hypothetical protein WA624_05770 [Methylocella sp.]